VLSSGRWVVGRSVSRQAVDRTSGGRVTDGGGKVFGRVTDRRRKSFGLERVVRKCGCWAGHSGLLMQSGFQMTQGSSSDGDVVERWDRKCFLGDFLLVECHVDVT
jgi:hypothetical protein